MSKIGNYRAIELAEKIRRNYEIINIQNRFCKECINKGQDCLDLEQKLENSVLIYKCKNYQKNEVANENSNNK